MLANLNESIYRPNIMFECQIQFLAYSKTEKIMKIQWRPEFEIRNDHKILKPQRFSVKRMSLVIFQGVYNGI